MVSRGQGDGGPGRQADGRKRGRREGVCRPAGARTAPKGEPSGATRLITWSVDGAFQGSGCAMPVGMA